MSLIVVSSERFAEHQTPPGHPERPERADAMDVVANEWRRRKGEIVAPREATHEQLARVHDQNYLTRLSAGACVDSVERVMSGQNTRALALVRPPGHHAERNRAMGFCLFNNVAIAAAHARARGLERVAIVDYDVHHGNGTQWSFYEDPTVLFISSHQYPYYPGTGAATDIGRGRGLGFTVNLPIDAGGTDEDFELAYNTVAFPILRQFRPQLILVSAGFDALDDDPLAGMRLTVNEFARLTAAMVAIADEYCSGRVVAVTEGGYDLGGLASCLRAVSKVLSGDTSLSDLSAVRSTT